NASGLVFTVEEAQSIVAQAFLRKDLFTTFNYNLALAKAQREAQDPAAEPADPDDTTCVSLPLDNLIECLMLFYGPSSGTASSHSNTIQSTSAMLTGGNPMDLRGASVAHIAFNGLGSDFELMLEERGVISVCRLATFFPEPAVDLDFGRSPVVQQLIIRSEWLRDAFNELDPSSEAVAISISATAPFFRISTVGDNGSTEMTYSKDERVLDSCFCSEEQENRYKLSLILRCKQALALSDKTKIRVNQRGFLSFQFMIPTDADVSFVNFFDLETLFKVLRISLHIPNAAPRFVARPGTEQPPTARAVIGGGPPRRFLYRGEKADACLVATIPNFEQLRCSLAAAMKRTDSPALADGELPLSAGELEHFFATLQFSVAAYQARTTPTRGGSDAGSSHSSPAMLAQHLRSRDDGKPASIAQPLKVSSIAGAPAFAADLPVDRPSGGAALAVERLDGGAWCCVYPWALEVPASDEPLAAHTDTALMFEIHASCQSDAGLSPAIRGGRHSVGMDANGPEEIQLEELATRLSLELLATSTLERRRQSALRVAELDRLSLESAAAATPSTLATKVVQILVPTRPVVSVSTRAVRLPRSYGVDAALVEIGVHYDAEPAGLALHSIALQSPEWRVQSLGAPLPLPLPLAAGTSCSAVFKASSLVHWADGAPADGLHLLNDAGTIGTTTTPVPMPARSTELSVLVRIAPAISKGPDSAPLVLSYRMLLPDRTVGGTTTVSAGTAASSVATPAGSLPSTHSGRSSDANDIASAAVPRHTKPTSLDYGAPTRTRKFSIAYSSMRLSEQRPRTNSRSLLQDVLDRDQLLAQRSRAATVNAVGLAPQSASDKHRRDTTPSAPATTRGPPADRGSVEMDHAATQQQPQRQSALHGSLGVEATRGELGIAFEAPPQVLLGEEVVVRVCLFNNTDKPFACLSLVDDSATANCSSGDAGPLDVPDGCGLLAAAAATTIPPLRPGESASVTLKYTAAAPHFHAAGPLRLLSLDGSTPGTTLAAFDAPFVVFVDDIC
ncbi:checkpoint clamp complex protein Rad1, partial [Coemansia spiralis]